MFSRRYDLKVRVASFMLNIRGISRSIASLGLIMHFLLTECNRSRLMSVKFPFALILAGIIITLWRWLRNNEWEVLTTTCPLLRNLRHKAMVTPVSPLRTGLIHISPSYWTIFYSFEIILEWEKSVFYANPLLQKIVNLIWNIFKNNRKKMLNRRRPLGL